MARPYLRQKKRQMLPGIYFQRLTTLESGEIVPDPEPLPQGITFQIVGYSQYVNYKLIMWRRGDGENFMYGEYLYQGTQPVAIDGGEMPLYVKADPFNRTFLNYESDNITSRLDTRIGRGGVPSFVARELRNPANTILF